MSNVTAALTLADLAQFTGTETWFRHPLARSVLYTEGAQFVAERGRAYWLLDEIALAQTLAHVKAQKFQLWTLTVDLEKRFGVLTCEDGDGNTVDRKEITYTDFPLHRISFYVENNVIFLPSED